MTANSSGDFTAVFTPNREGTSICATAVNQGEPAPDTGICRGMTIRLNPFGYLDEVSASPAGVRIRGWTIDEDTPNATNVEFWVNGAQLYVFPASDSRPDVAAVFPTYGPHHGYDRTVPLGKGTYQICARGVNVLAGSTNTLLGCLNVTQNGPPGAPSIRVVPSVGKVSVTVGPQTDDPADRTAGLRHRAARSAAGTDRTGRRQLHADVGGAAVAGQRQRRDGVRLGDSKGGVETRDIF